MTFPRNSLRAFLQYARTSLARAVHGGGRVNIVVGNESAGTLPLVQPWPPIMALMFARSGFLDLVTTVCVYQVDRSTEKCVCPNLRTFSEFTILSSPSPS